MFRRKPKTKHIAVWVKHPQLGVIGYTANRFTEGEERALVWTEVEVEGKKLLVRAEVY